jgi:hypothetical protein
MTVSSLVRLALLSALPAIESGRFVLHGGHAA